MTVLKKNHEISEQLYEEAVRVIPGGVNSPVRAFRSVGLNPLFIDSASGCHIYDADGNAYVDYVNSWGPMLMGHARPEIVSAVREAAGRGLSFGAATEGEVRLAQLVTQKITSVESLRLVNSGTEAVMSAIRLARGFTKRDKIVKFTGCYHGHSDGLLVAAGSGLMTAGVPDSAGVPTEFASLTISCAYNDLSGIEEIFSGIGEQIAAVIIEPVAANMGVVAPSDGFLQKLRDLTRAHGALLIFDEVITGFRLAFGGAQEYYGVQADLVTYGKILGGGMPLGAYGGRKDIMDAVAPAGPVYQAGTLSGNPIAVAAGRAMLELLLDEDVYARLDSKAIRLATGIQAAAERHHVTCQINRVGSLLSVFMTGQEVVDYESAKSSDTQTFASVFASLLKQGIYVAPSQFEALFVSTEHTTQILDDTIESFDIAFESLARLK